MTTRNVAKSQFWYLDSDTTNVTAAAAAANPGTCTLWLLSHGERTMETLIPLNRYSLFVELVNRFLPSMQVEFEIVLQNEFLIGLIPSVTLRIDSIP